MSLNTQLLAQGPVLQSAPVSYEAGRTSALSCLYKFHEVLPGLLAMFFIAIFANNLAGAPNPLTLENLFRWLDGVIGPVNHQPFFQILNANFVWNSFLLGLFISNIFGVPDSWKRGLSYIHKLMPFGIILLAPHFVFSHASKAGLPIILFALGILCVTALLTIALGRLFKVADSHAGDIAGALSTGDPHVAAILMPLLKARGGQVINAVGCVLLFGLFASFLLPLAGRLAGLSEPAFGLLSALGVGNTGQMFNAAFGYGYEAGRYAHYFDAVRHAIMPAGFLFVFFALLLRGVFEAKAETSPANNSAVSPIKRVPFFLLVFIGFWIAAQFHLFKEPAHLASFEMVRWVFSLAAAALGLSLPLREIFQCGWRGLALTCVCGTIRIVLLAVGITLAVRFELFVL